MSIEQKDFDEIVMPKNFEIAKLKAQRDALLRAAKNAKSTLDAYRRVLAAAGNRPFAVPEFVTDQLQAAISACEKD